ncbi:MAG: hypothetical protein ACLFOY_11135 [Desulfatibacillaceae bacterium]
MEFLGFDTLVSADESAFVFVATGPAAHLERLGVAVDRLRRFSGARILAVTDRKRNRAPLRDVEVVDAPTPPELTDRQAAMLLKTSLHEIVDARVPCCYLDTDVLAVRPGVEGVFGQPRGPVGLCPDHCRLDEFSPYAAGCGCLDGMRERTDAVEALVAAYSGHSRDWEGPGPGIAERLRRAAVRPVPPGIGGVLAPLVNRAVRILRLGGGRHHELLRRVERELGVFYDHANARWVDPNGRDIYECRCDHFPRAAREHWGVDMEPEWRHPNGGVFVFDERSGPFMDAWRARVLDTFGNPGFSVRDQGALAATAWEAGMENGPWMSQDYNCILDSGNRELTHHGGLVFSTSLRGPRARPVFVHLFHDFGNPRWDVWRAVESARPQRPRTTGGPTPPPKRRDKCCLP